MSETIDDDDDEDDDDDDRKWKHKNVKEDKRKYDHRP